MFSTIEKFQAELSVEVHRLSHVLDCQGDCTDVLYFHDAESGPGGGLGGLGRGGGFGGSGLSFMTASKVPGSSAAAGRGSEGRRGGTSLGSFELRQDVFHDPSLGTQVPPSSESNTLPIGMNA